MSTTSYKGQNLIIAGVPILTGRAKGDWLTRSYNTDEVAIETGIDGEGWFVDMLDLSDITTVVLTHSSRYNDFFMNLVLANRNAPTGLAFSMQYDEIGGTSSYSSGACKFLKIADGIWGDGAKVRAWRIGALRTEGGPGGLLPTPIISAADALALLPVG
jgi:hypothetical protein